MTTAIPNLSIFLIFRETAEKIRKSCSLRREKGQDTHLLLAGCASPAAPEEEGAKRYEATFLTLFDTVTTVVGYAESEEDFQATAQSLHDALLEYHQLYDIYSDYDGVVNLKGLAPATEYVSTILSLSSSLSPIVSAESTANSSPRNPMSRYKATSLLRHSKAC